MSNNMGAPAGFNNAPALTMQRSKFNMNFRVNSACLAGLLCPLGEPIEVLPGDTFSIDIAHLTRMTPTINVPLENIYLDVWFFFTPNRILWDHWEEFISGENKNGPWIPSTTYSVPKINLIYNSTSPMYVNSDSILGYMGIPTCINDTSNNAVNSWVNALPVRAYCMIWNQFFRDENVQSPILIYKGDNAVTHINTQSTPGTASYTTYLTSAPTGGELCPVCKLPDLFTTSKPAPQYGEAVNIPGASVVPMASGDNDPSLFYQKYTHFKRATSTTTFVDTSGYIGQTGGNGIGASSTTFTNSNYGNFTNLTTLGPTIRELQIANLTQIYLERLLRGGHRYTEYIKAIFGVITPNSHAQQPEYLGGKTFTINVSPVVQTSQSDNTPQGHVSGYSASSGKASIFTKSFTEHGYIIPLYAVRYQHTYSQGVSKMWRKQSALEFYNPIFANIGYQPVKQIELFSGLLQGAGAGQSAVTVSVDTVFGYQEAWYEYRYKQDLNVGQMRLSNFLNRYGDSWSVGDIYGSRPTLSSTWLAEDMNNLNRVLAIAGSNEGNGNVPQFISNFYVKCEAVRRMPLYSVPNCLGTRAF